MSASSIHPSNPPSILPRKLTTTATKFPSRGYPNTDETHPPPPHRMPNQGIISLCEAKKMGLTDFWKSPTDKRGDEVRSGAVAPSRTERKRCWESRDAYFACLDRNNILDAIKDDKAAARQCSGEAVGFEKDCAAEWVSQKSKFRRGGGGMGGYNDRNNR